MIFSILFHLYLHKIYENNGMNSFQNSSLRTCIILKVLIFFITTLLKEILKVKQICLIYLRNGIEKLPLPYILQFRFLDAFENQYVFKKQNILHIICLVWRFRVTKSFHALFLRKNICISGAA